MDYGRFGDLLAKVKVKVKVKVVTGGKSSGGGNQGYYSESEN